MNSKKINSGFTLIELMVTLAVLSIVSAIAIPSFDRMITDNRMNTQVKQLSSSVSLARSESTKDPNSFITLCPSADNENCSGSTEWENGWMMMLDVDGDGRLEAGDNDQLLRVTGELSGENTLRVVGFGSGASASIVQFFRNGQPLLVGATTAQAGTFVVCDERGATFARAIVVMVSGQMRLARDEGNDTVNRHDNNEATCP